MDYDKAFEILTKKQSLGIKPGLERILYLLDKMGNPQNSLKIIHIAGTNGKGTIANSIALTLNSLGFKVGLFTSPWVNDYREQIQINSRPICKSDLSAYVEQYSEIDSTEFEFITAVAYKYFADKNVDYAVVECGMGGLEDSTNAIETSLLSVITSVSLDHTAFLGDTLEKIAFQKAGIIKPDSTTVLYPNPDCETVFADRCKKINSKLVRVKDMGDFQKNNMATVKACLDVLGFCDAEPVLPKLPARQEMINDNIMLDGGHNPSAALALVNSLPKRKITAVIGMMKDKDVDTYLSILAPYVEKIITVTPDNTRSMPANELAKIASKYCNNVSESSNIFNAIDTADADFLLVCGSFFLARQARQQLLLM